MERVGRMLALSIMLVMVHAIEAYFDETKVIHVGGKVMCQDCTKSWNEWVSGARPIKGCRVSVTCLDERKRVSCYNSDETDAEGEFNMIINKVAYGKQLKPEDCLVRLVSSPDATCNVATNFGNGRTGVRLRQANVRYRGMVKYFLGSFYYTSPLCEEPDSSNSPHYQSKF
ncbi:hypothetical protein Ancab_033955 [Ancistrocladus abbreviatus]